MSHATTLEPAGVFVSSYFFLRDGLYGGAMPKLETWYRVLLSKASDLPYDDFCDAAPTSR